jgi:hypothetical protein
MPCYIDEEIKLTGITPRQHTIRHSSNGRAKYPFKAMIIGDYILAHSASEASNIRGALSSFYTRIKNRHFTVRPKQENARIWICRRVS